MGRVRRERRVRRAIAWVWLLLAAVPVLAAPQRAMDAIAAAVAERMGAGAEVTVRLVTDSANAMTDVATATPDPDARIGKDMWFTLRRGAGTAAETLRV